eukprot:TRINITY_DN113307_c0_g1_i1.p1 TRINITY_DN113307_c0_g1~~TRINITY_DN113307_c0_g1_i1.p1  ORF type:complete len:430 (-),score=84.63 TRINITY_DN113307_c0_g1_i1:21-1310(-)
MEQSNSCTVADDAKQMDKCRRSLWTLPKAHLHLHFPNAVVRRSTLVEWAAAFDMKDALEDATKEVAAAKAEGREGKAQKYERRGDLLRAPMSAFPGSASPSTSEMDVLAELTAMDAEKEQPGAAGVWDAQWISNKLGATASTHRVLKELYEDAIEEGVLWTELCCGLAVRNGEVTDKENWDVFFGIWRDLEKHFAGKTAVRFVVHVPKTVEDADLLLAYVKALEGAPVMGVGQWGTEVSASQYEAVYRVCIAADLLPVCVHAGESVLQAACPSGDSMDDEVAKNYDGVQNVRDALQIGARRIGHGIEAVKSASLLHDLAQTQSVALEVCPMSNRRLQCCEDGLSRHPLRRLLDAGVACCLAADDPAFFGSHTAHGLVREYIVARHLMGLDDTELAKLASTSIQFSLAPASVKEAGLNAVSAWLSEEAAG